MLFYKFVSSLTLGDGPVWLNARGNDLVFLWNGSGEEIRRENPLWWKKSPLELRSRPKDFVKSNWCLMFLVYGSNRDTDSEKPYQIFPCDSKLLTLCEAGKTPLNNPSLSVH